jgi:glycosyltransferase involved in cell wall biosynthesis
MKSILQATDIIFLPCANNEIPSILFEGMAMGIPVIASNVSAISELVLSSVHGILVPIHENGLILDFDDQSDRFSKAINFLWRNTYNFYHMRENCKKRIHDMFSFEKIFGKFLDIMKTSGSQRRHQSIMSEKVSEEMMKWGLAFLSTTQRFDPEYCNNSLIHFES